MKISIINPNSNIEITSSIQKTAEQFMDRKFKVVCMSAPDSPVIIETLEDMKKAYPGMMQLVKTHRESFDAFIIACHYDPYIDEIREISGKMVFGIGESSMKMASMLGHKFSIITTDQQSVQIHRGMVEKYNLSGTLASILAPDVTMPERTDREKYLELARRAVEEDMAEVIVLGCASLTGLDKYIQEKLSLPVLDGVVCALIFASGLVKYNIYKQ